MTASRPLGEFALEYAKRGWPVFRLAAGTNIPMARSHGHLEATTDPEQIGAWWKEAPTANVGVSPGPAGLIVFDVDPRNGGEDSFLDLCERYGREWTDTWVVLTPRGGQHLYYRAPADSEVKGKIGAWPGIDVKAHGGYAVLPPAKRKEGCYEWEVGRDPDSIPLLPAPLWLLEVLGERNATRGLAQPIGAAIPVRERNTTLTSLAGSMRRRGMGQSEILAALMVTNRDRCEEPLDEREVRRIAESVASYPVGAADPRSDQPRSLRLTDLGNAERMVRDHGDSLRYCRAHSSWYVWDGRRWARDVTGEAERRAKQTVRSIYKEASEGASEDARGAIARHALRSESNGAIQAMLARAQVEDAFAVTPAVFDQDGWLFNCLNGTIDLRTGNLLPHDRSHMISRLAPVTFDPGARDKRWDEFLKTACGGDVEFCEFLQSFFGYSLTGETSEEKIGFLQGPGGTGKGTFIEAVKAVMGDYAVAADFETFLAKKNTGGPRPDIARLAGARLVVASEADEGRRFSTAVLKQLTGGDTVTARFLYGLEFEFVPQFTLVLVANHAPGLNAGDSGAWRRLLRLPFEHRVPECEQDKSLKGHLRTGARSAVLAWLVEGCRRWRAAGLTVPTAVTFATDAYRRDSDELADFFEEELVFSAGARTSAADLHRVYQRWCIATGVVVTSSRQAVAAALEARGCTQRRGGGGTRIWQGVGLCSQPLTRRSFRRSSDEGDEGDEEIQKTEHAREYGESFRKPMSRSSPSSPVPPNCPACGAYDWVIETDSTVCGRCLTVGKQLR